MAATANPSGDNNQQQGLHWTPNELIPNATVDDGKTIDIKRKMPILDLIGSRGSAKISRKYASQSNIVRCTEIKKRLKDKTVLDVALRCAQINEKENDKRKKVDNTSARKNKDKKGKVAEPSAKSSSHLTNHSNGPPYAQTVISIDSDDGIPCEAIGGATRLLLEKNAQVLDQISANFGASKIHDNINLFCQARNNILSILNDLNELPEIMKGMPPLPKKINEELAASILPGPSLQKKSWFPEH